MKADNSPAHGPGHHVHHRLPDVHRSGGHRCGHAGDHEGTGVIDVFIFGATPAEASLRRIEGQGLAAAAEEAAKALRAANLSANALTEPAGRLQLPLWGWALARTWSPTLPPASPVSPNVALLWQTPARGQDRAHRITSAFDIVANGVASDLSFSSRVAQGVLDTVVEHAMLADSGPAGNTAAIHGLDLAAGRPWIRLDRLNLPGDAKARIKADLADGDIVIAQSQPSRPADGGEVGWWRVDPRTGVTLGIGENGRGQALPEFSWLLGAGRLLLCGFFFLGERLNSGGYSLSGIALGAACAFGAGFTPGIGPSCRPMKAAFCDRSDEKPSFATVLRRFRGRQLGCRW